MHDDENLANYRLPNFREYFSKTLERLDNNFKREMILVILNHFDQENFHIS